MNIYDFQVAFGEEFTSKTTEGNACSSKLDALQLEILKLQDQNRKHEKNIAYLMKETAQIKSQQRKYVFIMRFITIGP